ncbi:MAG: acyl-CoA dehydrogenase [Thermodesulfobacteriota bacterium]
MSDLVLTEEQQLLQRSAADFAASLPVSRLRALRDSGDPSGFSPESWRAMAQLGWPGIPLPEEYGGLGLGYADLAVVLEELGKVLAPEPFLSTVLLGGNAIVLGGSDAQKRELLPRVAKGDLVLALAHHEPGARHEPHHVDARAVARDGGFRLTGVKDIVLDGGAAERLVVSARTAGAAGERAGLSLFLVDPRSRGVTIGRQQLVDHRAAALIRLDGVEVPADALIGELGKGADVLDPVLDRAVVGLCAEMLGGMVRAFEMTLAYLKERKQFGVVIGTFQALKHRAARMFIETELARSAVMAAARALDDGSSDAPLLASVAKARLSEGFVLVASEAVQMHGGIGMTDEHDIGFYLKRARAAEILLGDAPYHRDRAAALQGY